MSFVSRLFRSEKTEQRSVKPLTLDQLSPWVCFDSQPVGVKHALSIPAVCAAVGNVADTISTLPLPVFRADPVQGGEKDYAHPVYNLLNKQPNSVQTAKAFRHAMIVDLMTEGEFFAEIIRDGTGTPVELWQIPRAKVRTDWDTSGRRLRYFVDGQELDPTDVIHVVSFSIDGGIRGISPFHLCRESLALTSMMDKFGTAFFRNSARPSGILNSPPNIKAEEMAAARKLWESSQSGAENSGKTAVLPDGFTWSKISVDPEEAQYIESRQYQLGETQRICRVPPAVVADYSRQTWANIQYARMDYVQNTIRPLVVAVEQELNRKLLGDDSTHYFEHVLEGLLRGSFTEQVTTLTQAVGGPIYTANEARKIMGLPPVDGGDDLNTKAAPAPAPAAQPQGTTTTSTQEDNGATVNQNAA